MPLRVFQTHVSRVAPDSGPLKDALLTELPRRGSFENHQQCLELCFQSNILKLIHFSVSCCRSIFLKRGSFVALYHSRYEAFLPTKLVWLLPVNLRTQFVINHSNVLVLEALPFAT